MISGWLLSLFQRAIVGARTSRGKLPCTASLDPVQSGCVMPWGDPDDYNVEDPNTPANATCTQYGLFPFGEYLYFTHDIGTGSWGIYPTNGTWHY